LIVAIRSKLRKIILGSVISLVLLVLAALLALWLKPPDILRVGANYSAKIVCSNVFLAGRDPDEVLRVDVQAPGIWLLRLMRVSVDRQHGVVRAGLLGFIGDGLAVARPGVGCAALPDGNLQFAMRAGAAAPNTAPPRTAAPGTAPLATAPPDASASATSPSDADEPWPMGNTVSTNPALDQLIADDTLAGPGARAIVVVYRRRIVAERYAAGFSPGVPLLGWSMTKSVLAGLVGALVKDGRLTLDQSAGWPAAGNGGRERIRIADLLDMSSGLRWNEGYGDVSDVTRMLYLQSDMADFAREKPLAHPVGEIWNYSSGTANILSRIAQDAAGSMGARVAAEKLFKPLGMASATIETDEYGTLVGSSYMYATARDWARYGEFVLQEGIWRGQEILPRGYVAMMASPVASSGGQYGHGLVWLWGSDSDTPGKNPDAAFGIPADTFWMSGHDGQTITVIPSREMVIVRLGLTPSRDHYTPQPLVKALLDAVR
jgi:CubicO group peptidase (beta-lactamase class C family)